MFAVVDLETTGSYAKENGITEIAIVITDGLQIKSRFSTLLRPNSAIPYKIQQLTGINDNMVADAPSFADKAQEIKEALGDHVFVAHNVNFDLGYLQANFKAIGHKYNPKRLCTVRYARKIFPGLHSYSLSALSQHFNEQNEAAHRAWGDAEITTRLLHRFLAADKAGQWQHMIKRDSGELNLPAHLARTEIDKLPLRPGVYLLKNAQQEILYIGKATRLKTRVLSHFGAGSSSKRKATFHREVHHVDFRETANVFLAGLLEDHLIRNHWPPYNRAQKSPKNKYGVFHYVDRQGNNCLIANKQGPQQNALAHFFSLEKARSFIRELCEQYGLDPSKCGLYHKGVEIKASIHEFGFEQLLQDQANWKGRAAYLINSGNQNPIVLLSEGLNPVAYGDAELLNPQSTWNELVSSLDPLSSSATAQALMRSYLSSEDAYLLKHF